MKIYNDFTNSLLWKTKRKNRFADRPLDLALGSLEDLSFSQIWAIWVAGGEGPMGEEQEEVASYLGEVSERAGVAGSGAPARNSGRRRV
jgi:hypothetical protein